MNLASKKSIYLNTFYCGCIVVAFVLLCFNIVNCGFNSVWIDEVYSMGMIDLNYYDIIIQTAGDVHPPLYYILLKLIVDPLSALFPFLSRFTVAKFASMLCFICIFYFCIFKVSKLLPKFAVGLFIVLIFAFLPLKDLSTSVRMYSFASLFIFFEFYYFIKIVKFGGTKYNWWMFILFFELSAYTHNYALVSGGILFVYLILFYIFNRRESVKVAFKHILYAILIYLPWFCVLISQMTGIHNNYWISDFNFLSLMKILHHFLVPSCFENCTFAVKNIIAFVLMAFYLLIITINILNKKIDKNVKWIMNSGVFVTACLFTFAILFSILIDPIFVARYTNIVYYIFIMSICLNLYYFGKYNLFFKGNSKLSKIAIIVLSILIFSTSSCFGITSSKNLYLKEKSQDEKYVANIEYLEKTKAYNLFDDIATQIMFDYLYGKNSQTSYCYGYDKPWWENFTKCPHKQLEIADIKQILQSGENVIYFTSKAENISEFNNHDIKTNVVGEFLIGNVVTYAYCLGL